MVRHPALPALLALTLFRSRNAERDSGAFTLELDSASAEVLSEPALADASLCQMVGGLNSASAEKYLQWELAACQHGTSKKCRDNPDAFVMLLPTSVRQVKQRAHTDTAEHDATVGGTVQSIDLEGISDMSTVVGQLPVQVRSRSERHPDAKALDGCKFTIGLLGGLGPVAGATLLTHVVSALEASALQNDVCVALYARPRWDNLFHESQDSAFLSDPRFSAIGIACNTFHIDLLSRVQALAGSRFVNLLASAAQQLDLEMNSAADSTSKVLLIGTKETIQSGLYQKYVEENTEHRNVPLAISGDEALWQQWWPSTEEVEKGNMDSATELFRKAAEATEKNGTYSAVVLGCTEFSAAYAWLQKHQPNTMVSHIHFIDPLDALSKELVKKAQGSAKSASLLGVVREENQCKGVQSHSTLLNADVCRCTDDNYYGKECDVHIEKFPYMPGGWSSVDGCLSFMASDLYQTRAAHIADLLSKEKWLEDVNLIVELGSYRTPVITQSAHLKPGMSSVLVDPLTRFSDVANLTSTVELLRANFLEVKDLFEPKDLNKAILVLLGVGGCSTKEGKHSAGDVQWTQTLSDFAGRFRAVVVEGAFEECWDCKVCWDTLHDRYVSSSLYKHAEEKKFDFSSLPEEQRTQCFHPTRTMHVLRRND